MLFEITIVYLVASIIFLVNTLRDKNVPKNGMNILILTLLSLVWPIPVILYLASGKK